MPASPVTLSLRARVERVVLGLALFALLVVGGRAWLLNRDWVPGGGSTAHESAGPGSQPAHDTSPVDKSDAPNRNTTDSVREQHRADGAPGRDQAEQPRPVIPQATQNRIEPMNQNAPQLRPPPRSTPQATTATARDEPAVANFEIEAMQFATKQLRIRIADSFGSELTDVAWAEPTIEMTGNHQFKVAGAFTIQGMSHRWLATVTATRRAGEWTWGVDSMTVD